MCISTFYLDSQRGHNHHHLHLTVPQASPSSEQDTLEEEGVVFVCVCVCVCVLYTKMSYSIQKMSPPLGPSLRSSSSITSSTCTSSRMSVCAYGCVHVGKDVWDLGYSHCNSNTVSNCILHSSIRLPECMEV